MTPLNVPCPTKYFITGNLTSPNNEMGEVILLALSFLTYIEKIGGTIHKEEHNDNNESQIARATNWLGRTIFEQGSKLKGPSKENKL